MWSAVSCSCLLCLSRHSTKGLNYKIPASPKLLVFITAMRKVMELVSQVGWVDCFGCSLDYKPLETGFCPSCQRQLEGSFCLWTFMFSFLANWVKQRLNNFIKNLTASFQLGTILRLAQAGFVSFQLQTLIYTQLLLLPAWGQVRPLCYGWSHSMVQKLGLKK